MHEKQHRNAIHSLSCFIHSDFPSGSVTKKTPDRAGDAGLIPGSGRSPGGGNGNPLEQSCQDNPMDKGA